MLGTTMFKIYSVEKQGYSIRICSLSTYNYYLLTYPVGLSIFISTLTRRKNGKDIKF